MAKKLSELGPPIPGKIHGGEPANDGHDHFYTAPSVASGSTNGISAR
jgi:hypothetical protein